MPRSRRTGLLPDSLVVTATAVAVVLVVGCGGPGADQGPPSGPAPDSFRVEFRTNKGTFVVESHRAWAPHGVDRFYQLVNEHFFDENRFFRVLPGFIAQFGASDDRKRNEYWEDRKLPDDSAVLKNERGTIAFAHLGPGTRTHQLFINLKNNPNLDRERFAPVGRIVEGMSVADSINDEYGQDPKYDMIARLGNKYLARMFPRLDYIESATVVP